MQLPSVLKHIVTAVDTLHTAPGAPYPELRRLIAQPQHLYF